MMTKTLLQIILSTMNIFTDERRRKYSSRLLELKINVDKEKAKTFPYYSDAQVAIASNKLDNFLEAYGEEFKTNLLELVKKGISDE